ncbi:MAG: electron transfer flavoprotein subunit beta/FixA family protein [Pseudolysinimonas sp.]
MKIVVLTKEVPDTYGERRLDLATGLTDRSASDPVADEIGERALEAALAYADGAPDTEIVLLSMGPATASATLRKLLAIGGSSAVHVLDDRLLGADLGTTARVLAAAIRKVGFDVVITGNLSTDGAGGVMAAMVAEHLGVPHLTNLAAVALSGSAISGTRAVERGHLAVSADLPAVISVTEALPDPRFPNFKGIVAAKKKPLETWSFADLGLDEPVEAAESIVLAVAERPARAAGIKIVDSGDAGVQLADYLTVNGLA